MILIPLRYLFLFSLTFSVILLAAQDKACKPALKANRHKVLRLGNASIEGTEYRIGDLHFQIKAPGTYLASSYRKITVRQSGKILAEFNTSGSEISDKLYREYNLTGKLKMIDSLGFGTHLKTYMGFFQSSRVSSSTTYYTNGSPAGYVRYNPHNGHEAVIKEWYTNYFPKSYRIKNCWQSDSVVTKWDSTGILRERRTSAGTELYYPDGVLMLKVLPNSKWSYTPDGILEDVSRDTLIAGKTCRQKKTFYPNGILKSVEYYSNDEPCYTWTFYTPEGLFKHKLKKGPPTALEIGVGMVEDEYAPEIFTYVEQHPEYPGGDHAFRNDMEKRMVGLLCKSETELSGSYKLRYTVNESGEAVFHGLEGINAELLSPSFAGLFNGLPKWKPGKQNGRLMTVHFAIDVSVKEN